MVTTELLGTVSLTEGLLGMWAWGVLALAVGLVASIALHEVGHMVPAKRFGAKVTEFMVGFGPKLWSTRKRGTDYGFRLLPLGGYVRILGMFPPAPKGRVSLPLVESAREQSRLELEGQQGRPFWRLTPGRKAVVMAGGPLVNLLLWVLLSGVALCLTGVPSLTNQVSIPVCDTTTVSKTQEPPCSPAAKAGVASGDLLVSVGGQSVSAWTDVPPLAAALAPGQSVPVTVERNGEQLEIIVVAGSSPANPSQGWLGLAPSLGLKRMGLPEAGSTLAQQAQGAAVGVLTLPLSMASLIADTFSGAGRDEDSPIGVVGLGRLSGEVAQSSEAPWQVRAVQVLLLIAGLNLALFLFNMVPLLPLDGGHLAAAAWEAVRRKWAKLTHKEDPGPVDVARLLPLSYAMAIALMAAAAVILFADIVNPLRLS